MDLTFVPMARGFVYLSAVVVWFSWGFCLAAVDHDGSRFLHPLTGRHRIRRYVNALTPMMVAA
jgi:hypothetical protein